MPRRLVSVDDAFNIPDSVNIRDINLPDRLSEGELTATILEQTSPKLDRDKSAAKGLRLASIGDSWIEPDTIISSDFRVQRSGESISAWANANLGSPFNIVGTFGISSQTSGQIMARLAPVLAVDPDVIVINAGGNDVLNNIATATILSNLQTIYDTLRSEGAIICIGALPPTSALSTTAQKQSAKEVNDFNRSYSINNANVIYVDWVKYLGSATAYEMRSTHRYDPIHPNHVGASWAGKALADALRPFVKRLDPFPATNADPFRGSTNPLMLGSGQFVPNMGDGWRQATLSGSVGTTLSKIARTDGVPAEIQQTVQTGTGTQAYYDEIWASDFTRGFVGGDTVEGLVEFLNCDLSAATAFQISLAVYRPDAGTIYVETFSEAASRAGGTGRALAPGSVLRTPPITLPANTSIVQLGIQLSGPGTLQWSRNMIRKVN